MIDEAIEIGSRVGELLIKRGETLGVAETSCGGMIAAALLSVPDVVSFYLGGGVVFALRERAARAAAPPGTPSKDIKWGPDPAPEVMAQAARDILGASWGLSVAPAVRSEGDVNDDSIGQTRFVVSGAVYLTRTIETKVIDPADKALKTQNMIALAEVALSLLEEALHQANATRH